MNPSFYGCCSSDTSNKNLSWLDILETTGSRSRLNIVGGLNLTNTNRTVVCEYDSTNSENIVRFFCQLRESYPLEYKLHFILDSAGYHRSQFVKDAAYVLNIELYSLPPVQI